MPLHCSEHDKEAKTRVKALCNNSLVFILLLPAFVTTAAVVNQSGEVSRTNVTFMFFSTLVFNLLSNINTCPLPLLLLTLPPRLRKPSLIICRDLCPSNQDLNAMYYKLTNQSVFLCELSCDVCSQTFYTRHLSFCHLSEELCED